MKAASAVAVMHALNGTNAENPAALFVGGCVRNAVLGIPSGDIDIATIHKPDDVTARLSRAGIKSVPTGLSHGTVTAVIGGESYEITTLRRDVATDGRHAVVEFTCDWAEDTARRDFTINTLLADAEGHVYDLTGTGIKDLEAGRVVFVGDPARRIAEDYLRILRFFRFYAQYGKGAADAEALSACRDAADKISRLSRERVTQEFLKILMTSNVAQTCSLMFENNVLKAIFPTSPDFLTLDNLEKIQTFHGLQDVFARIFVLVNGDRNRVIEIQKTLLFSNAQKKMLGELIKAADGSGDGSPDALRKLVYRSGFSAGLQSALVDAARMGMTRLDAVEQIKSWTPPVFPLTGRDVRAAGVADGPRTGTLLADIENWWVDSGFKPDRAACLAKLAQVMGK